MIVPDRSCKYLPAVGFLLVTAGAKVTEGLIGSEWSVAATCSKDVVDWTLEKSKVVDTGSNLHRELLLEV